MQIIMYPLQEVSARTQRYASTHKGNKTANVVQKYFTVLGYMFLNEFDFALLARNRPHLPFFDGRQN